jgi:hypothetical protein
MGRLNRWRVWAPVIGVVVGITVVSCAHFLPGAIAAATSASSACPYQGTNNLTSSYYYYVYYNTSTGAIDALEKTSALPYVGPPVANRGEAVLNLSSNLSLVASLWCDAGGGHLAYWHVDPATRQLVRTPS